MQIYTFLTIIYTNLTILRQYHVFFTRINNFFLFLHLMVCRKHIALTLIILTVAICLNAQPAKLILNQEQGSITFAVDDVDLPKDVLGLPQSGTHIAQNLKYNPKINHYDYSPKIIYNSFGLEQSLYNIGEDVVFQMLMKAWCQHRPVVLSPDVIWMLICQQFSHYVNEKPNKMRSKFVHHQGKKELVVETKKNLFSNQADWDNLIQSFVSLISTETKDGISKTLVADFSTTGRDELFASEITLMDVVKPYFEYTAVYAICGIPSITLTGTPEDWKKVLDKTMCLKEYGLEWWISELKPILEEFVKASEGNPDYWFWKDIVKKSRPRRIQGPSCGKRVKPLTRFDGWFLKFFPFDNRGRTPNYVTIGKSMFSETVAVPLKYIIVDDYGNILGSYDFELVAGIVGVTQNPETLAFTPKIGWFVRYYCSDDAISTF